jgi:hypothetical protein
VKTGFTFLREVLTNRRYAPTMSPKGSRSIAGIAGDYFGPVGPGVHQWFFALVVWPGGLMRNRILLMVIWVLAFAYAFRGAEAPDPSPAPFLRVGMERMVRQHDIVYRQPAVRPSDYMPLGNGDVGLMVDPLGSMTLGGWVVKSDLWLQLHRSPILSGLYSLQEVQESWAKGGAYYALSVARTGENPSDRLRA